MIGLGTAAIGRPQYINIKQESTDNFSIETFKRKGIEVLDNAYDQGIRYFDTAPGYGMAEQLLIDWCKEKQDEKIEIATKWGYTYVANFDPNATQHEIKEHSLFKLNEQWEQSKKLFPYLTTYQIHSATFETGVLENEAVLNRLTELKEEYNLIIGISTTGDNQAEVIKAALEVEVDGSQVFDAFQSTYNMLDSSLMDIMDELKQQDKRVIIKEAMANGRLFPNSKYPHYQNLYQTLEFLANKYSVGIDAIALRFCEDTLKPFSVLSGVSEISHLLQNLKANAFELEKEDVEKLKSFAVQPSTYWQERKLLSWN